MAHGPRRRAARKHKRQRFGGVCRTCQKKLDSGLVSLGFALVAADRTFVYLFAFASIVMVLTFVVVWARNFKQTRQYMPAGLTVVAVLLTFDVTTLLMADFGTLGKSPVLAFFLECWVAVRIYAFAVVGLMLADRLNAAASLMAVSGPGNGQETRYGISMPPPRAWLYTVGAIGFLIAFTVVLFQQVGATINEAILVDGKDPFALSSVTILLVAAMGFGEEITFRLGLQNGLTYLFRSSRFAHYWAVLATAAFWSLGHLGTLEPGWVKLVQVFAIGLVLGQMNRMFGVVPCIITHSTFNVLMVLLAPTVFGHMLEGV